MLELKNVTKNYQTGAEEVHALKGVDICFRDKEFVSILGPSGCGKTTLLNIIGGLDKYSSGDLIIDGTSTKDFSARDWDTYRNHKIGFVFQSYNLISHLSILENVEMALTINGVSRAERKARATEALQKVGLADKIDKRPNQLSGGQMQRVAIARAIVNNPSIILADEPTGALDSKTSVQVMELIKEIAQEKLVIMVTHNSRLAKKYSTRIISLVDGRVKKDTLPFDEKIKNNAKTEQKTQKNSKNTLKIEKNGKKPKKEKMSAMSFLTALYLSFKNLLHKRGRTILTSVAGSIGIIGIALVLSISAGLTNYLGGTQNDALSGSSVSISTATIDYDALAGFVGESESGSSDTAEQNAIMPYESGIDFSKYLKYGHFNFLGGEFADRLEEFNAKYASSYKSIQYSYYLPMRLISFNASQNQYMLSENSNTIDLMSGDGTSVFFANNLSQDIIDQEYEVVSQSSDAGSFEDIESKKFELTLVVDKNNRLKVSVFRSIGYSKDELKSTETATYFPISFDNLFSKTYKLVDNNHYYDFDESSDSFSKIDTSSQGQLEASFSDAQLATLKITKIIRQKEGSENKLLSNGLMYSGGFENWYMQNCKESQIAQKQSERFSSQLASGATNFTLYDNFVFGINGMSMIIPNFADTDGILQYLQKYFKCNITSQDAYKLCLQQIGASSVPQSIKYYPTSFASKDLLGNFVADYNSQSADAYKILVTDTQTAMSNALKNVINIISSVLVAFASISLVVSSIMIGIITYVSVIERTKEIGVLRSIGARKKDIARVFSAEAMIIGLLSGVIGIAVSYALGAIINIVVENSLGVANIAILSPVSALVLVAISILLTFASGLIPSKIASTKDPVECLRNE